VIGYLLAAREYWRLDRAAFLAIFFAVVVTAGITGRIAHWLAREGGLG
jgi:hypothetical protein